MASKVSTSRALGFAAHSGWAAVVVVGGSASEPRVFARERIEMTDPRLPGSKQPYHTIESLALPEAAERLRLFEKSAYEAAQESIRLLVENVSDVRGKPRVAGILDSAGRTDGTLAAILASHSLIHTADGNHFREALAEACRRCGMSVTRVRQKDLLARAATTLQKRPSAIEATINALGRPLGPPWGADQKSAALLAWLLIASLGQ